MEKKGTSGVLYFANFNIKVDLEVSDAVLMNSDTISHGNEVFLSTNNSGRVMGIFILHRDTLINAKNIKKKK
jgi:uncharacterized protein YuzE